MTKLSSRSFRSAPLILVLSQCFCAAAFAGTLAVTGVEPAQNSMSASPSTSISVTFNVAVDPTTVSASSFWAFARWSGPVEGTRSISGDGTTITLTPDSPLSAGESVMVILSDALTSALDDPIRDAGYSFHFWVRPAATGALDFEEVQTIETGMPSRPYGAVGSDMDEDGFLDLTTINEDSNDLRVFLNNADGSGTFDDFVTPTAPTGNVPSPNEPSDFDRDGHVDLALANTGASSLSVLLGNGDGSFGAVQLPLVGNSPHGIAVLDADGDGDMDLASADTGSDQISLLLNDGTGTFSGLTSFGPGDGNGGGEWGLASADMNNDGILDLVAASGTSGNNYVWVYAGNGDGTFTRIGSRNVGVSTWMLVLGDVNGDADVDVALVSSSGTGVIVHNAGDGTLSSHDSYAIDPFGIASDLADLDGDGDLDWVTSSFGGDWWVFRNDGLGTFTFDQELPAPEAASCSVALDIDNDGDLDLALVDELADQVVIVVNQGSLFRDGFESGNTSVWSAATP